MSNPLESHPMQPPLEAIDLWMLVNLPRFWQSPLPLEIEECADLLQSLWAPSHNFKPSYLVAMEPLPLFQIKERLTLMEARD
jgi:hypothetical protein